MVTFTAQPIAVIGTGTVGSGAAGPFASQSGDFTISWDAVPSQNAADVVTGLSLNAPAAPVNFACIARFANTGNIDVRNGGAYAATATVPYSGGTSYHFRLIVRLSNHTYDVYVTPSTQAEILLANNFAFRTEQASVASLNYLAKFLTTGDAVLSNRTGPTALPPQVPVVTNGNFTFTVPATTGQIVGTMTASGSPTSWAISGGNSSGYFAIANNGNITVTSAGASGLSGTATVNLTVQATNVAGNGSGTATINYAPQSVTGPVRLFYNSPRFANNTPVPFNDSSVFLPSGAIRDGQAFNNHFLNDPTLDGPSLVNGGNYTMDNCNLFTRKPVGLWNVAPPNSTITITNTYLEALGLPNSGDHSDVIQVYTSGAYMNLVMRDSTLQFHLDPTSTASIFMADGSSGSVTLDNCVFPGEGGYALRLHADAGQVIDVSLKDVYIINGIVFISSTGGVMNIRRWDNVCNATYVNGQVVPGSQIPPPYPVQ